MDDERKLNGPPDYLIWAIDRGHSNVMHFNAAIVLQPVSN